MGDKYAKLTSLFRKMDLRTSSVPKVYFCSEKRPTAQIILVPIITSRPARGVGLNHPLLLLGARAPVDVRNEHRMYVTLLAPYIDPSAGNEPCPKQFGRSIDADNKPVGTRQLAAALLVVVATTTNTHNSLGAPPGLSRPSRGKIVGKLLGHDPPR